MHAAFVVGLMHHCLSANTPHPGFVAVDSPLTPFRGADSDDEEDPELRADVHSSTLRSLAAGHGEGQAIIMENIDPPPGLDGATVHVFTGQVGHGRSGFYPV